MEHSGELDVVGPLRLAGDELRVLLAQPAAADLLGRVRWVGSIRGFYGDDARVDLRHAPPPRVLIAARRRRCAGSGRICTSCLRVPRGFKARRGSNWPRA